MSTKLFRQTGLALLIVLCVDACQHKVVDLNYPDERGEKLANLTTGTSSFNQLFGWSPDGTELFYMATSSASTYQIKALNIQSRTIRMVAQDTSWHQILAGNNQVILSPDGQSVYFSTQQIARTSGPTSIYRVDTRNQNQIVLVDSNINNQGRYNSSMLLSSDGSRLSFRYRHDSIRVHNLASKTSIRIQAQEAITFSPDASRLIVSQGNSSVYRNVSLTDLSATDVDVRTPSPSPSFSRGDIVWQPEGIRYVYSDFNSDPGKLVGSSPFALVLWNVTQQKSTVLRVDLMEEFPVQSSTVVWSRNGQRIAYTTSNSSQSLSGSSNQVIYATDIITLKTTKVATNTLHDDEKNAKLGSVLISPDNTKLAYAVGSTVYIATIPQ